MSRSIDYGNLMHRAMRGLIQSVLTDVSENGLPGAHHFFITFDTTHPDVDIADWLHSRYPAEMTVVIQHWFENLKVTDDGFAVTLNFGNQPEPLRMIAPDIMSLDAAALGIGLVAGWLLLLRHWSLPLVLALSALASVAVAMM